VEDSLYENRVEGVIITPLSIINTLGGDVLHGMKYSDSGYSGFGEAYFSVVDYGVTKGWKRHKDMVLNLIVPLGKVCFVLYDSRYDSDSYNKFQKVTISREDNYARLTVPPMVWMGFKGVDDGTNMLLNIANIKHSPSEVDRKPLNEVDFDWSIIK